MDNQEIGVVTSGTFSPALERGVGLGFIAKDQGAVGQKILIGNETNKISAEIVKRPILVAKNGQRQRGLADVILVDLDPCAWC